MTFGVLSDVLLVVAAAAAAIYCMVLSRRLKNFNNLQNGMGGAVAVLSAQVDDLSKMLERAEVSAAESAQRLQDLNARSDEGAKKLEVLLASLHDLPAPPPEENAAAEPPAQFLRSDVPSAVEEATR